MESNRRFTKINILLLIWLLVLCAFSSSVNAQYQGEPVKKDGLLRALRSKQFQSRDIVDIIQTNGVNFKLDPADEAELVAAGARPSVLEATRNNYRQPKQTSTKQVSARSNAGKSFPNTSTSVQPSSPTVTYNSLLEKAINSFDVKKDRQAANDALQEAVKMQPTNPRAYQLLGFLNLYGAHNFDEAERYWKIAISNGGSAVLRVIHDHSGTFLTSCQGSLYISRDKVRFESDDNKHTFETGDGNIKEIKVNSIFKRLVQVRPGSFKIALRKESKEDETNFNFAPLSGSTDESKMIIRLISKK
jgi:hypothetical protein